jgi:solute carrier family 25, member 34/35
MFLKGELMRADQVKHNPYKNIYKSVQSIVKAEGLRGLQKGLSGQLAFQFVYNSIRLGTYQTIDDLGFLSRDENGKMSTVRCVIAGGFSGFIGVSFACPFYMIKTQLQSQSSSAKYAVGFQHKHKGLVDALKTTFNAHGLRGLWKGYSAIVPRNVVGSSVQLSTFSSCKELVNRYELFSDSVLFAAVVSSLLTGFVTCVFMTPFDTAATRMFNQPVSVEGKGLLYKSVLDCFIKVTKTEGFLHGFYKGFGANYFRMCPQHLLNLTFWEQFKKWNRDFQTR